MYVREKTNKSKRGKRKDSWLTNKITAKQFIILTIIFCVL